jgi:hypothetical protein
LKPGRPCSICANPEAALRADGLIAAGVSLIEIASTLGVSKFCVSRHKKHSSPTASETAPVDELAASDERLLAISAQLQQQFLAATGSGDSKTALECTKLASRIETELHRRATKKAQTVADDANDSGKKRWPTPAQFDNVKRKVDAAYARQVEQGFVFCQFCQSNKPVDPRIIEKNIKAFMENQHANSSATN